MTEWLSVPEQPRLRPGERLLWSGRPDPTRLFSAADAWFVPFSLLWGGFALFWNVGVWVNGESWFLRLWGVPFLVVGFYMIVGRFIVKRRKNSRLRYQLTSLRAVILDGSRSAVEVPLSQGPISRDLSRDGRHLTVTFGSGPRRTFGASAPNVGLDMFGGSAWPPAFYDVSDVDGLRSALDAAGQQQPESP